jgi:hypothetical protein
MLQGRTVLSSANIARPASAGDGAATVIVPCNSNSNSISCSNPCEASQHARQLHSGVLLRARRSSVTAAAVPPSKDSSFNSSSSSSNQEAAHDRDDADYADLAEDDNIIMLGSADEEDDEYDSYGGYIGSSSAAVQRPAGQVVSSAMSEDEFRAAMAAARQQVRQHDQHNCAVLALSMLRSHDCCVM